MYHTIIGIDLGLNSTAIIATSLDDNIILNKKTNIGYSLKLGSTWNDRQIRIEKILDEICDFINKLHTKHIISAIVFEGPSLGSKGAQMHYIGELHGALYRWLLKWAPWQNILEVPPTSLKKFATGKGNVSKSLVAAHVQKRWDQIFRDDDLTDAYVLCQIGRAKLLDKYATKIQKAVADKLIFLERQIHHG